MVEKDKMIKITKRFNVFGVILIILLFLYLGIVGYNIYQLDYYKNRILPNTYLEQYKLGEYEYDEVFEQLSLIDEMIENNKLKVICNGKEYEYTYKDLGISLDKESIVATIKAYQKEISYNEKFKFIYGNSTKKYLYKFKYNRDVLSDFLNKLKVEVDVELKNGYFDISNGVHYVSGNDSFSLDVEKSIEVMDEVLKKGLGTDSSILLVGSSEKANYNDNYKSIDTKVSSFSTEFNPYLSQRVTNLRTALNYINGAIIEPGEVFSFYKYAGPYNKRGYVFYYEFVGNGVCQIATTVYNAALLGGLEIVKRYPHKAKSVYVKGGLDATVASYSSGWNVDLQFKNTYKYPIYVLAYMRGNRAYVEFYSNSAAKEGKTYQTESIQIGTRGYTTYLYTYKDGVQLDKKKIATTWYSED